MQIINMDMIMKFHPSQGSLIMPRARNFQTQSLADDRLSGFIRNLKELFEKGPSDARSIHVFFEFARFSFPIACEMLRSGEKGSRIAKSSEFWRKTKPEQIQKAKRGEIL
jgi:hypothetical protein